MVTKHLSTQEQGVFNRNIAGIQVSASLNYKGNEKEHVEEVKEEETHQQEVEHDSQSKGVKQKKKLFGLVRVGGNHKSVEVVEQNKTPVSPPQSRQVDYLGGGFIPKTVKSSKSKEQVKSSSSSEEVVDNLLKGELGSVFSCRFQGQEYALKVFLGPRGKGAVHTRDMVEFIELDIGSRIVSDYLVPIVRVFTPQETGSFKVYGVLTHLSDGDLHSILSNKTLRLDKDSVLSLTRDILGAVYHLHSQGVYHLNIKAENVLIYETAKGSDGERFNAKLNDFKFSIYHEGNSSFNEQCAVARTYAPPEFVFEDSYQVSDKTDVWSLCIVLLELLLSDATISETASEIMRGSFKSEDISLEPLKNYFNGLLQRVSSIYGPRLVSDVLAAGLQFDSDKRSTIFELYESFASAFPKLTIRPCSLRTPRRSMLRSLSDKNRDTIYKDLDTILKAFERLCLDVSESKVKRCLQPATVCAAIEFYLNSLPSIDLSSEDDRRVLLNVSFTVANNLFNRKSDRFNYLLPFDREKDIPLEQKIIKDKAYALYSSTLYKASVNNYFLDELVKKYIDLSYLDTDPSLLTTTEKNIELTDLVRSIGNKLSVKLPYEARATEEMIPTDEELYE